MSRSTHLAGFVLWTAAVAIVGCGESSSENVTSGERTRSHRELLEALRDFRPIEPRVTGLRGWAPCRRISSPEERIPETVCDRIQALGKGELQNLLRLGEHIRRQASSSPSAASFHARGVERLTLGSRDPEIAVSWLEQAVLLTPRDADRWSDLAAAYLVRARSSQRPEDLVRGLGAAHRALAAEPEHRVASFNRALALELLFLRSEAADAWREAARRSHSPDWQAEARQRASAMRAFDAATWADVSSELPKAGSKSPPKEIGEIVATFPLEVQRYVRTELLGAESPPGDRDRILARDLAAVLERLSGDSMLLEESRVLEREAATDEDALDVSSHAGYVSFRRAKRHYEDLEIGLAMEAFEDARRLLEARGNPLSYWASYWIAVCRYWQGDLTGAERGFEALSRAVGDRGYPLLAGHLDWMTGLIAANQSRFDRSIRFYRNSATLLERAGAVREAAFVRVLLAEVLEIVGDSRSAWDQLYPALARADDRMSPRLLRKLFDQAAASARAIGEMEAALYFQERALEIAFASQAATVIAEGYYGRAAAFERLGDTESAFQDLAAAHDWLERITDPAARQVAEAGVLITEARLLGERESLVAMERLAEAAADLSGRQATVLVVQLLVEKARILRSLGRAAEAGDDLRRAMAEVEAGGRSITREFRRSSFIESSRDVYDELVRFELDVRGDADNAFVVTERARAHEFLTGSNVPAELGDPPAPEVVRRRLPPAHGVLAYRVLDDRLLIWVLRPEAVEHVALPFSRTELSRGVESLLRSLSRRDPEEVIRHRGARLYEVLIAPVATHLEGVSTLFVAADRPLFRLPFAVLFDPVTAQFLIERHALAKTLRASPTIDDGVVATLAPEPAVLAVGDPAFDTLRFSQLPRLDGAREEVETISRGYRAARVLLDTEATKPRFLAALPHHDVVHFAGHALANSYRPELSSLVLSAGGEADASGVLYATEIEDLTLRRPYLVVLAGCRTASGEPVGSGGTYGLARSFLEAGVPFVVASLWDVEDRAGVGFFERFHDRLLGSVRPETALRETQAAGRRGLLDDVFGPSDWSSFELFVGRPPYHPTFREDSEYDSSQ